MAYLGQAPVFQEACIGRPIKSGEGQLGKEPRGSEGSNVNGSPKVVPLWGPEDTQDEMQQTSPRYRSTWRVPEIRRVFVHLRFLLLASDPALNCLPHGDL